MPEAGEGLRWRPYWAPHLPCGHLLPVGEKESLAVHGFFRPAARTAVRHLRQLRVAPGAERAEFLVPGFQKLRGGDGLKFGQMARDRRSHRFKHRRRIAMRAPQRLTDKLVDDSHALELR